MRSTTLLAIDLTAWAALATTAVAAPLPARLEIEVDRPGTRIPASFDGLMTEEINYAYDGGLLAELIQNRTFQDPGQGPGGLPLHWSVRGEGRAAIDRAEPVNAALPLSLRLDLANGESGLANDGYWGIPVRPATTYTATFFAKAGRGFTGPVTASLRLTDGGTTVVRAATAPVTPSWRKYTLKFTTPPDAPTTADAVFELAATGPGAVWFSFVSLFPPTYGDVPNGLRPDLMELLAGLRPRFIRLPGGNYLEGGRFADRFNWKQMIGPPESRPGHLGCWGYRSSDGLGLPQFLLWCQQLGAEPVLGLFAGYVLNGDHFRAGSPEMALYTQEALEEIEYVMGPATSPWGSRRAADGFPEPFPLRYVEIGNEDWFDKSGSYDGRFTEMATAIRARYPQLEIIASAPVTSCRPDLYDDHFYRSPNTLLGMTTLYDPPVGEAPPLKFIGGGWTGRQPDGIQTFVGEWAAHSGSPTTDLRAGLADAAFVMGLQRNSDAVVMQCYAPLLTNVNLADEAKGYPKGWQWNHNLIGYDALGSYGSPSYHAQTMLAQHRGDVVLPARLTLTAAAPPADTARGGIGVGSWQTQNEYTDLTVTAPDGRRLFSADLATNHGWETTGGGWQARDGALRPARGDAQTWAVTGDRGWTDYTIRLRARKLGGQEGFIVLWHAIDGETYQWWNIGGWNNTLARCEAAHGGSRAAYGEGTPFRVETGRWYDLRLEVSGRHLRGYIDDQLVTEADYEPQPAPPPVVATATLGETDGAIYVNLVNAGAEAVAVAVDLRGVGQVEPRGTAIVLAGEPGDMNSLAEPRKVSPIETAIDAATTFQHTCPPYSFTILKLKAARR